MKANLNRLFGDHLTEISLGYVYQNHVIEKQLAVGHRMANALRPKTVRDCL